MPPVGRQKDVLVPFFNHVYQDLTFYPWELKTNKALMRAALQVRQGGPRGVGGWASSSLHAWDSCGMGLIRHGTHVAWDSRGMGLTRQHWSAQAKGRQP